MNTRSGKTRARLVGLLLVLALVAAACGGDDDGEGATGDGDNGDGGGEVSRTITVGVAYPDLETFADINPAYSIGDPEEQAQAVLNAWREAGRLPVNGIDIELAIRPFDPIDDTDKLAVCQAFAEEDDVFAVMAGRIYAAGAECLADRFEIPVISQDAGPASVYERAAPYYFTLRADESRVARNFVAWADEAGLLEDRAIGLYHEVSAEEAVDALKDELTNRGYELTSEVQTGGQGVGSEQDQVAVQRFQADGVDLVIPMAGGTSSTAVMNIAEDQGYEPEYLDFDYSEHMSDVAALGRPESQQDGVRAVTTNLIGDLEDGELRPESEECLSDYEAFSGKDYPRELPASGELTNVLITCSLGEVFLEALTNATDSDEELTKDSFVEGLEAISDFPVAFWDRIAYGPDDHSGAETQRQVVFDSECGCWLPDGDFEAFPV